MTDTHVRPEQPHRGRGGRGARRRRWVIGCVVVVVTGGAAAGIVLTNPFGHPRSPATGLSANTHPTALRKVVQRSLASQTEVSATLGNRGSYTVVNRMQGTYTHLPAAGKVFRQGDVLYRVNGNPVILLYGPVPAYRTLSDGTNGADARELNSALVSLGYASRSQLDPHSDVFTLKTAYALEQLQSHLDVPVTGELTLGQAVFLPSTIKVSSLSSGTVPGSNAPPGGTVLTATSTRPVVTVNLPAGQQTSVKKGDRVTITLPGNRPTPGVVSSVGTVATTTRGSTAPPTITVLVTPTGSKVLAGLTSAPVNVTITTASVSNALVVPVTALLSQPGGGYAVEEVTAADRHHLVPVHVGPVFDDTSGMVQVSGPGLAAGQRVVVPAP